MDNKNEEKKGYKLYASFQMFKYVMAALIVMVFIGGILSFIEKKNPEIAQHQTKAEAPANDPGEAVSDAKPSGEEGQTEKIAEAEIEHAVTPDKFELKEPKAAESHAPKAQTQAEGHSQEAQPARGLSKSGKPAGWAFAEAITTPLENELNRFYGWRPNDIIKPTDNVENIQLGVLEVTRRTVEILTERIAKTGSIQAYHQSLFRARSNFNYSPYKFWLPSAESEYENGIKEINAYKKKLGTGEATFYTRSDNLIYLLDTYRNIIGSCEENLAKIKEENGDEVSFFKADDYFYYAQGVAIAMSEVLKAIEIDFDETLKSRNSSESLHHAIESLEHAQHIHPIIVLNSDYSSFFANHRANMSAPFGHAKFYLGVMIRSLST